MTEQEIWEASNERCTLESGDTPIWNSMIETNEESDNG